MSCCIVIGGCLGIGVGCMYLQLLFDRARLTNVSCTCVCMCVYVCLSIFLLYAFQFNTEDSDIYRHAGHIRAVCRSRCMHWQESCDAVATTESGTEQSLPAPAASKENSSKPACVVCGSAEREDQILLCDTCDAHYHVDCLGYPEVSDGGDSGTGGQYKCGCFGFS